MTVPSLARLDLAYSQVCDQISKLEECVTFKLELGLIEKKKYSFEIFRDVDECVFRRLNDFPKTRDLIRAGNKETSSLILFVILISYMGGKKKEDQFPQFLRGLFEEEEMGVIESYRNDIRLGAKHFSVKADTKSRFEEFYDSLGLTPDSSKEDIAAVFLYDPPSWSRKTDAGGANHENRMGPVPLGKRLSKNKRVC